MAKGGKYKGIFYNIANDTVKKMYDRRGKDEMSE